VSGTGILSSRPAQALLNSLHICTAFALFRSDSLLISGSPSFGHGRLNAHTDIPDDPCFLPLPISSLRLRSVQVAEGPREHSSHATLLTAALIFGLFEFCMHTYVRSNTEYLGT
jgi:hypothetical protein